MRSTCQTLFSVGSQIMWDSYVMKKQMHVQNQHSLYLSLVWNLLFLYLIIITRHSLVERRARYLFYCMFVCSINNFSTTRGPIHAKVRMRAYSGSGCVFSPFGGWRPPAGGKRGKWNFRYYESQWGIFAFWRFFSDISATLARIHTKYYLCRDNVCRRAPSPCGAHRPLEGRGGGVKNSKNWGVVSFVHRTATISIFLSDAKIM